MFQEKLHNSEEYQAVAGTSSEQSGGQGSTTTSTAQDPDVPQLVAPVVSLEKTDVQFWLDVAKLVVLLLIWRELVRQGGA